MASVRVAAWAQEAQYSSFWAHYDAAERWRLRHQHAVYQSQMAIAKLKAGESELRADHVVTPTTSHQVLVNDDAMDSSMDCDEDMEIDPDYAAFRAKTLEHQRLREEQRRQTKGDSRKRGPSESSDCHKTHWLVVDNDDYVNADQVGVHGACRRTTDAPDEKRLAEERRETARQRYGSASQRILALETALDEQFNTLYRQSKPSLWPNIPLKF